MDEIELALAMKVLDKHIDAVTAPDIGAALRLIHTVLEYTNERITDIMDTDVDE
jgi:hypothetical protein